MELALEEAADAFGALSQREPEPIVELLDREVIWIEYLGPRPSRTFQGAQPVADLLRQRVKSGCRLELTGIAKIGRDTLEVGYTHPWWLDGQGMGARLAYYLLGDARQCATMSGRITRIESVASYFAPRSFETQAAAQDDLISLLRR